MSQAQTGTTQYPINDPRNPNCPCHVMQKKADEEYKREQKLFNKQNIFDIKNVDVESQLLKNQPLPILNQMADVPQENNIVVQAENNFDPVSTQLASAPINKPEINFSFSMAKPSFGSSSGSGTYRYKTHHWKKFSFKAKRKFKKMFDHKKKIRVRHSTCFEW